VGHFPDEPRLPDAGLSDDGHDLTMAGGRSAEGVPELLHLLVSPDEAGEAPGGRRVEPRAVRARAGQLIDLHGHLYPLDRYRPQGRDLDVALRQSKGVGGQERASGASQLLHAGGQMGCLPDRAVVHAEVAPDGADDDLAGVQPDPDVHREPMRAADLLGVAPDRALHVEGRVARAHGVILVGQRRAEEGHDPVAHHLVHGALVAVDGFHHVLEDGIEQLARLLGITVGQQLHRALEVGEQHGDLLALALEGTLRGENLLGEMLGGVRVGRRRSPGRSAYRPAALQTELRAGRQCRAALGARGRKPAPAFEAELRRRRVLMLAPGTVHAQLLRAQSAASLAQRPSGSNQTRSCPDVYLRMRQQSPVGRRAPARPLTPTPSTGSAPGSPDTASRPAGEHAGRDGGEDLGRQPEQPHVRRAVAGVQ
jgi:hypothetical protein